MHDIDRTLMEMEWEGDSYGEYEFEDDYEYEFEDDYEYEYEFEDDYEYEFESPLGDAEEMELAADLLEITDDAELDYFLGSLVKKASRFVKRRVPKSVRNAVKGRLKSLARRGLGLAGRAVGTYFGGPVGGAIGGKVASGAGRLLGLELEGMSPEDQEFEVARRFVRLSAEAAKQAAKAPAGAPPQVVAKKAIAAAAQKHAPGLVAGKMAAASRPGRGRRGIWKRRGNKIVLFGI